ncbi:terminase small subunit [Cohnella yongneupensis]|uniref:Terminase small subunit n=1 Tax=Cohnella yongneupensis TaxID=425006 RepID=A0ABW0R1L9_9BACL
MGVLTLKQQLFVQEYIVDLNATQAAIRAGYSVQNAGKIGPELLGKTRVSEAIQLVMAERVKRTQITADRVLAEYAKIGFADITKFVEFQTVTSVYSNAEDYNKSKSGNGIAVRIKDSSEIDGAAISEVSVSKDGKLRIKLHDKKGALDSIARHLGMFSDKSSEDITGDTTVRIQFVE